MPRIKLLLVPLKVGEILCESLPQLTTQWLAILWTKIGVIDANSNCSNCAELEKHEEMTNETLVMQNISIVNISIIHNRFDLDELENKTIFWPSIFFANGSKDNQTEFSGDTISHNQFDVGAKSLEISFWQTLSVTTSTLAIVSHLTSMAVLRRRKYFISGQYPIAASVIPLYLYVLSGIGAMTTQFGFFLADNSPTETISFYVTHSTVMCWTCNILVGLFTALTLLSSCSSRCRCWRFVPLIIHLTLCGGAIISIIVIGIYGDKSIVLSLKEQFAIPIFGLHCLFRVIHTIFGSLIMLSKEILAHIFSPVVFFIVNCLRVILKCCPSRWRVEIDILLDRVLHVEKDETQGRQDRRVDGGDDEGRDRSGEIYTVGESRLEEGKVKVNGDIQLENAADVAQLREVSVEPMQQKSTHGAKLDSRCTKIEEVVINEDRSVIYTVC